MRRRFPRMRWRRRVIRPPDLSETVRGRAGIPMGFGRGRNYGFSGPASTIHLSSASLPGEEHQSCKSRWVCNRTELRKNRALAQASQGVHRAVASTYPAPPEHSAPSARVPPRNPGIAGLCRRAGRRIPRLVRSGLRRRGRVSAHLCIPHDHVLRGPDSEGRRTGVARGDPVLGTCIQAHRPVGRGDRCADSARLKTLPGGRSVGPCHPRGLRRPLLWRELVLHRPRGGLLCLGLRGGVALPSFLVPLDTGGRSFWSGRCSSASRASWSAACRLVLAGSWP